MNFVIMYRNRFPFFRFAASLAEEHRSRLEGETKSDEEVAKVASALLSFESKSSALAASTQHAEAALAEEKRARESLADEVHTNVRSEISRLQLAVEEASKRMTQLSVKVMEARSRI